LIAGIGAQTFYPREGVVPMWAALAVALRLWVQRQNTLEGEPLFPEDAESGAEDEEMAIPLGGDRRAEPIFEGR
jgi:hypothetical protein